jgi:putative ABC transport system substrate-binding protein
MCKLAALFVDKILRGVKPAELPVDRATKFETVLNMKNRKDAWPPAFVSCFVAR